MKGRERFVQQERNSKVSVGEGTPTDLKGDPAVRLHLQPPISQRASKSYSLLLSASPSLSRCAPGEAAASLKVCFVVVADCQGAAGRRDSAGTQPALVQTQQP